MSIKFTSITSGGVEIPIWDESAHSAFSNYYTKTQTDDLLHGRVVVVQTLPETGEEGIVYYVGPQGDKDDKYEEYIWTSTESKFIKVGERSVDLSDYQPISGMSAYATNVDMQKAFSRIEANSANISALDTWKTNVTPIVAGVYNNVSSSEVTDGTQLTFTKVDGTTKNVTVIGKQISLPQSANWNSTYTTVNNNSATWSTVTGKQDKLNWTPVIENI